MFKKCRGISVGLANAVLWFFQTCKLCRLCLQLQKSWKRSLAEKLLPGLLRSFLLEISTVKLFNCYASAEPQIFLILWLESQVEVLTWLASVTDYLDMDRVAVHGWSYGGYLSLMALIKHPDIFKVSCYYFIPSGTIAWMLGPTVFKTIARIISMI